MADQTNWPVKDRDTERKQPVDPDLLIERVRKLTGGAK